MYNARLSYISPLIVPELLSDRQVHGTSAGGDADELRLLSTSSTYINLRAYGGNLDFVSTKVSYIV